MVKKKQRIEFNEVVRSLAEGIKKSALRPNVFGYKPHTKQIEFHTMQENNRLFIGGNRSGKTVAGAVETVWMALGKHPYRRKFEPPVRLRICTVDLTEGMEQIIKPALSQWIPPSALVNGSWMDSWNQRLRLLTLENESAIEILTYEMDVEKFAGTSRHGIWFDEEPPKAIFEECRARLIDTGGCWWITMTPVEGMTWTFDDIYERSKNDPFIGVVEVDMTDNIYLPSATVEAYISGLDADEVEARVHGRYIERAGLIYKMFDPKVHLVEPFLPGQTDFLHCVGMDHGYNNPTAFLWGAVHKNFDYFIYDEYYESGRVVEENAKWVHRRNAEHGFAPAYYVGDPSIKNVDPITGTSIQIEYVENGIPIVLGNNDVKAGIVKIAGLLKLLKKDSVDKKKPRLFITKNCIHTIREMRRYRWADWATSKMREKRNKKEEPQKKDDHAMDALRYLIASRPEVEDLSFVPEFKMPEGVTASIAAGENLYDARSSRPMNSYNDFHLGEEW